MTALWTRIKNEPVVILTLVLLVLQLVQQGADWLTVAIAVVGALIRQTVTPAGKVEDVKKNAFYAGVTSTKAAYGLDKHDSF